MNIALSIDQNYVIQCIVLIFSIIISANKEETFTFYIMSENLSEPSRQRILSRFREPNIEIQFIEIDRTSIKAANFTKSDYITLASYYRLLIPELLPQTIKKVLYLDCDMLVIGSLRELWETSLENFSTAVTADAGSSDIRHFNRLNISTDYDYFNAGMLLINMEYWRENQITKRAFDFIVNNPGICVQHDQDVLNKLLLGTVKYVSSRYNYLDSFLMDTGSLLVRTDYLTDIVNSASHIVIIHYSGGEKPWHNECSHPYRCLWHRYRRRIIKTCFKTSNRYRGFTHIKKMSRKLLAQFNLVKLPYKQPAVTISHV